jgi:hypothetical protein
MQLFVQPFPFIVKCHKNIYDQIMGRKCMNYPKSAVFAVILALLIPIAVAAEGGGEQIPFNPKGVVEYTEGEVLIDNRPAEIGQEIALGAAVQTGESSLCIIVFAGKNIFRIQEQTHAILEIDEDRGAVNLKRGAMAAVFSKLQTLSDTGGIFRLQTPTAMAGVRGTAFFIKVEDENNTYICTCNGQLGLADVEQGNARTVRSERHSAYRFSRSAEGIRSTKAPLLYHNDSTLNFLAAKIRVRIPWGDSKYGGDSGGY